LYDPNFIHFRLMHPCDRRMDGQATAYMCYSIYAVVRTNLLCYESEPFFPAHPVYACLFFTLPVCRLMPLFVMEARRTEDYGKNLVFQAVFMVLSTVYLIHVHHLHLTKTDGCSFSLIMFTW